MRFVTRILPFHLLVLAAVVLAAFPVAAEPRTSSDLLLPYFEVELGGDRTTLFALGNGHGEPAAVQVTVFTN
ncbi:MAG TPA: hypothetical protein VF100_01655, partial [Thermoanaerobaculia bacterium]